MVLGKFRNTPPQITKRSLAMWGVVLRDARPKRRDSISLEEPKFTADVAHLHKMTKAVGTIDKHSEKPDLASYQESRVSSVISK